MSATFGFRDFGKNAFEKKARNLAVGLATITILSGASIAAPAGGKTGGGKVGESGGGFFVGAELGWNAIFNKTITKDANTNTVTRTTSTSQFPLTGNIGVKLGYAHFFNKWLGLRGYASYNYGFLTTDTNTTTTETNTTTTEKPSGLDSYHQVAGNVDFIFKFLDLNSVGLGAFVGVGAGYASANSSSTSTESNTTTTTNTNAANGFVLPVNAGLEAYIGKHHSASLNFRIPTFAFSKSVGSGTNAEGEATQPTTTSIRNLIISLGYSYTF